jgi:hypothetical protein
MQGYQELIIWSTVCSKYFDTCRRELRSTFDLHWVCLQLYRSSLSAKQESLFYLKVGKVY